MAIAIWNSRFETGIELIDSQHRELFEAVNKLADSFRAGLAWVQVKESIEFLEQYALDHFQAEERFMREMGYPGLASHQTEHVNLMEQVRDLKTRLAGGELVTMDITIFFVDWLKKHINDVDMAYVDFVKARNRG
jgi:hemerythrin